MMCMEECSEEMKACEGEDNEEDMKRCMRGELEKAPEGKCMMCKKKSMEDEDEMMNKCKKVCSAEMEACKGKEGEEMKKCMAMENKKNPDSACMKCAKSMMDDGDDKKM